MSLLERLDVPAAQSRASSRPTERPRLAASSATPAPVTPPPITRTSTTPSASAARSAERRSGDSSVRSVFPVCTTPTVPRPPVLAPRTGSQACRCSVRPGGLLAPVHRQVHGHDDQGADDEPEERAAQRVDQPADHAAHGTGGLVRRLLE